MSADMKKLHEFNTLIKSVQDRETLVLMAKAFKAQFVNIEKQFSYNFRVGDTVSFKNKSGVTICGDVVKINRKTIKVRCYSSYWNVSPSLLHIAEQKELAAYANRMLMNGN